MKGRYQELMTFEALDALIAHLGGLRDERKHVLVLTNGFRLFTKNATLSAAWSTRCARGHPDDRWFNAGRSGSPASASPLDR